MPISKPSTKLGGSNSARGMSGRDRERFFFFMAMMMRTGQTTSEALRAVAKSFKSEKKDAVANSISAMGQKVAQGRPLSAAMQSEKHMFADIHRAAILAGEASNNMQKSFEVLRVLEEKKLNENRAGIAELLTPFLMLVLSCVSIFNTGLNTLPVMATLREAQGKPMGAIPSGIINVTGFFADFWLVFVGLFATMAIIIWSLTSNPQGRTTLHAAQLKRSAASLRSA